MTNRERILRAQRMLCRAYIKFLTAKICADRKAARAKVNKD